jgi:hypothetical protein
MSEPDTTSTAADWNGQLVRVDHSPGGVLLLCDVDDALIHTEGASWPPPQIAMKLGAAQHSDKLPGSVKTKLGHYCALQSINSEDAITWNYFGGLINRSAEGAAFLNWLCGALSLPWGDNTAAATDVWRRVPHPDKPIAPGPELDAMLVADHVVVLVEAKWGSVEGTGQGVAGDKGQIQLRREFLTTYGRRIWGDRGLLVLGVTLDSPLAVADGPDDHNVAVASVTWAQLAECSHHPHADEFARYLAWKAADGNPA